MYLRYVGAVDDAPMKLLINDLPKREHFDAEHNVANAIFLYTLCFSFTLNRKYTYNLRATTQHNFNNISECFLFIFFSFEIWEKKVCCFFSWIEKREGEKKTTKLCC